MKPAVLLTRPLMPDASRAAGRLFRVTRSPALAQAALTHLVDRVDGRFFDRHPRVRVVSQVAAGVDNVDLKEAARRGVAVMNTPGVLTETTADLAWALILAVARRIPQADRLCREGRFRGWDPDLLWGRDLNGRTLGVVGAGRIGAAVARRAAGFGMRVLYHRLGAGPPPAPGARPAGLRSLLRRSDVVTLHVPASPATRHLIGREELARMKPGSILINTSRGTVVDERALIAALRRRRLWGAGLDVFEREPRVPAALRRMPHVVLTPHIGSATRETRTAMAMTAVRNLVDFFAGRPDPDRLVLPEAGPAAATRRPTGGRGRRA